MDIYNRAEHSALPKKILIIGDAYCGKTSLLKLFCNDEKIIEYNKTVFDIYQKHVTFKGVTKYLEFWDTSGMKTTTMFRELFYPCADIVVILFDVSNRDSLLNVTLFWEPELKKYNTPKDTPTVLVGNKCDLRVAGNVEQEVTKEEAMNVSKLIDAKLYTEVSAVTKKGVEELFRKVVEILFRNEQRSSKCRLL